MAIKFEATGDFSDLIRENQRYQKEVTSLKQQLHDAAGAGAQMGSGGEKAFRDLQKAADQAKRSIESPTAALQRSVEQLDEALAKGMLTQKEYAAAVGQMQAAYQQSTTASQRYQENLSRLDDQLRAGQITTTEHAQAVDRLGREFAKTATPAERYERGIADLNTQLERGTIDQAQHTRATGQLRAEYQRTQTPMNQMRSQVQKLREQLADGTITQTEYTREVRDVQRAWEESGKAGATVNQSQAGWLHGHALKLGAVIGAYGSMHTAISKVTDIIADMRAKADDAADAAQQAAPGLGQLAQLAETREEMQQMLYQARLVHAKGGASSLDEAAKLVFSLQSAGASQELDMFSNLKRTGLVNDPAMMAKAAKTIQESMGEEEAGTFAELVSKAFGASKYSPSTAEGILEDASRGGTAARALGMRDEEVIAATAQISAATGSADTAGTQVASLLKSLVVKGDPTSQITAARKQLDEAKTELSEVGQRAESERQQLAEQRNSALETIRRLELRRSTANESTDFQAINFDLAKHRKELNSTADRINQVNARESEQRATLQAQIAAAQQAIESPDTGFAGLRLDEMIEKVRSKGMGEEDLQKYFGREEAVAAFRLLSEGAEKFREIVGEVDAAAEEQRVFKKLELGAVDPSLQAAQTAAASEALEEESRRLAGTFVNLDRALHNQITAGMQAEGRHAMAAMHRAMALPYRFLTSAEQRVEMVANQSVQSGNFRNFMNNPLGRQIGQTLDQRAAIQREQQTLVMESRRPGATAVDAALLNEVKKLNEINQQQLQTMRSREPTRPGSTAAAAAPSPQRQGR